jgi:tripartite-type tricarboxylate transporter receptor subunit TctC
VREGSKMKLPRRNFLNLVAGAAALSGVSRIARAQTYPARPVRIVVGFVPGNPPDIFARLMGQWLSERLGQPFVVENRPGAGGTIGTEVVVRSTPDGYTLLVTSVQDVIGAMLYDKLNYNFVRDITPVATLIRQPLVMVVHPSFSAKTVPEFIAHAIANPGKVNMASAGNGTPPHLAGALFQDRAGINMVHVPYRGGAPALTDLIGGQVQVIFVGPAVAIDHLKSGRLRALAVTSATRWQGLPDVPTVGDVLPGYEVTAWIGVGAPKSTPAQIIDKLNEAINAGLADAKLNARLAELGGTAMIGSPADFGKFIADDTEKWGKVIRAANIKAE